jgi:hypothetical protein
MHRQLGNQTDASLEQHKRSFIQLVADGNAYMLTDRKRKRKNLFRW